MAYYCLGTAFCYIDRVLHMFTSVGIKGTYLGKYFTAIAVWHSIGATLRFIRATNGQSWAEFRDGAINLESNARNLCS